MRIVEIHTTRRIIDAHWEKYLEHLRGFLTQEEIDHFKTYGILSLTRPGDPDETVYCWREMK